MKRSLVIKFKDGTEKELEISKAVALRVDAGMMHLDRFQDGKWRLMFSDDIVKDFSTIESFQMKRED